MMVDMVISLKRYECDFGGIGDKEAIAYTTSLVQKQPPQVCYKKCCP